jgi:type IV secretory pathway TrbD component
VGLAFGVGVVLWVLAQALNYALGEPRGVEEVFGRHLEYNEVL